MRAAASVDLRARLEALARARGVPGASVAVLDGDVLETAATGLASTATGVEVTADTLFQIGSITKIYTTTLVMQLVDEGLLSLDDPVSSLLPDFRIEPASRTGEITIRRLLSHTSGLEGDVFDDFGRGDDCVARYVEAMAGATLIHEPGAMFSYCNAGFVLAGRIVEVLRGATWDAAIAERITAPLGLERTVTLPEQAIMHRVALGHAADPETGDPIPASVWHLPRATGPAGVICATPADVLAFARAHLDGGEPVLSSAGVRAMQEYQVDAPFMGRPGDAWGLGWTLSEWDGLRVIGHNGGTLGQLAFLRLVPEHRFGICLLTNSRLGGLLAQDLLGEVVGARFGIEVPGLPAAVPGVRFDPRALVGRYARANVTIEIAESDDGLVAAVTPEGLLAINTPPMADIVLDPVDATRFLLRLPGPAEPALVTFIMDGGGRAAYLHTGGRVSRRT